MKKIKPMTETFFRTVIKAGEKLKFILTKSLYASRMIHHEVLIGIKIQPNRTVSLFAVHTNLMMLTNFNCFQINTTLVSFLPNSLIRMFSGKISVNKSVFSVAMYCLCHYFLYLRTECIMLYGTVRKFYRFSL